MKPSTENICSQEIGEIYYGSLYPNSSVTNRGIQGKSQFPNVTAACPPKSRVKRRGEKKIKTDLRLKKTKRTKMWDTHKIRKIKK